MFLASSALWQITIIEAKELLGSFDASLREYTARKLTKAVGATGVVDAELSCGSCGASVTAPQCGFTCFCTDMSVPLGPNA